MSGALTLTDLGISATATSDLSADHAAVMAAALDADTAPRPGDVLPAFWHWGFFTPTEPTATLGADGHPPTAIGADGRFVRRMWASGRIEQLGPLVVGEPATRHSELLSVKESEGRTGALRIVRVGHRYQQGGADRVAEEQTLVYRAAGSPVPLPAGDQIPTPEPGRWQERHVLGPAALFRFSAVTFNSHRIHYDHPYATGVEGYPALVVHGPLTALLVARAIETHAGRELAHFSFRASAPLFAELPFTIIGDEEPPDPGYVTSSGLRAAVLRNDGTEAFTAVATLVD